MTIQADLQYVYKRYRLFDEKYLGNEFEAPYHFINPRFGINYQLSKRANTYISISQTSREPRLKNLYDAGEASTTEWEGILQNPQFEIDENGNYNFDKPLVKPEELTDVEIGAGYKYGFLNSYMNVFYMLFNDEIIKKGKLDRFGQPITGNAEKTIHKGIEFLLKAQVKPELSISANFMYSRNILDSYTVFNGIEQTKLDGNPISGFPEYLANIRFSWMWKNFYLSPSMKYIGKQYTDNFKNNSLDAYSIINIDFHYSFINFGLEKLVLQGRINNILNKMYLAYGNGIEYFPAATRNAFISLRYVLK